MVRNNLSIAAAATILIAAAAPATAADEAASKPDETRTRVVQTETMSRIVVRPIYGASLKAEDLIGKKVTNFDGETVGDIESVLLDRSGRVQAVVIGVGGFLGLGEHDVAVNWQDLYVSDKGDAIHTELTKDMLKQIPEYEYADEGLRGMAFGDNRYRDTLADERKYDLGAARPTELRESAAADSLMDRDGNLKVSELIGMEIVGESRKAIGEIEDILVAKDGKPLAAVGVGGFLGIGKRVVLIGWDKIDVHREKDRVQIRTALSEADLKKMPERKDVN